MATSSARGKTDSMNEELDKAILSQIRKDELVAMCSDVVNIPSPTGEELEMGRYMRRTLEDAGLSVSWQEVEEGRANVVGLWEGAGNGKSLMFNGHMDTSNTGREEFLTGIGYKPKAVIKDGLVYGLGIYNMKGALVCYTQAMKSFAAMEWGRIISSITACCPTCASWVSPRICNWFSAITALYGSGLPFMATMCTPVSRAGNRS